MLREAAETASLLDPRVVDKDLRERGRTFLVSSDRGGNLKEVVAD